MSGCFAANLPKFLEVVERQPITTEIKARVQEHRTVSGGKDKAIASVPAGILWIVPHEAREEQVSRWRHPHRHSGVARVGLLNGVDRKDANGIDAKLIKR